VTSLLFDPEPESPPDLPHWLIVREWSDELVDDGELFEVEHHPDCPIEVVDAETEHPYTAYNCVVDQMIQDSGLDGCFQHRDDPARGQYDIERVAPGRWLIEPWFETYRGFEYTEYGSGLRVVQS